MIYLFNSAARVGYIENVLNTLHLPKGSENVYQYSIKSGPYVHASISQTPLTNNEKNEDVLIIFVNKDNDPYQFIPLRKARLIDKEIIDGRMYFTVILGDYCVPNDYDYDKFSNLFIETFGELVFRAGTEEAASKVDTKEQKINKGFLAFKGTSFIDNIISNENAWLKTVEQIKKVKVLADNYCIYTKLQIRKNKELYFTSKRKNNGLPLLKFNYGSKYCAELSYYVPFQDDKTGSYLEVEMISSPDVNSLQGGALKQRLNVLQGVAKYRFKASEITDSGEIVFSILKSVGVDSDNIKMAWKGVSYKVKRNWARWVGIIGLLVLAAAASFGSSYYSDCITNAAPCDNVIPYYILTTLSSLALPGCIWGASTLWSKKG